MDAAEAASEKAAMKPICVSVSVGSEGCEAIAVDVTKKGILLRKDFGIANRQSSVAACRLRGESRRLHFRRRTSISVARLYHLPRRAAFPVMRIIACALSYR